jgi:imidazoleglycerol-phosphate dehydratase
MAESRIGKFDRKTAETDISVELNLDGAGKAEIKTGVGFFDHMMTHITHHGLFDLKLVAEGDHWIDDHHTIEDVGICFGKALALAVGDKAGMTRYGHSILPMDETLVMVALDFSGRPYLGYDASFDREMVGGFSTEMVPEFFRAVAVHAGMTLHIKVLSGSNAHHIIEGIFKAFGRALSMATRLDPRIHGVLSTKVSID